MMQQVDNDVTSAPMDDLKEAKETHPHHEEEISDGDDVIQDPDYTPTCGESSAPENEDSLTMVATTLEQQNKDVYLNNADRWEINTLVQNHRSKMNQGGNISKECHTRAKAAKKQV